MLGSLIILSNILPFKSGTQKTLLFVYFIAWKKKLNKFLMFLLRKLDTAVQKKSYKKYFL